jgi:hypothetical protein
VQVHADRYLKGKGAANITLMLVEGPSYSQYHNGVVRMTVSHSVKFSKEDAGKQFLFFLDKGGLVPHGREAAYRLRESEYHVLNRYLIREKSVEPDPDVVDHESQPGARSYPYDDMVAQILRVAVPQSQLGESGH